MSQTEQTEPVHLMEPASRPQQVTAIVDPRRNRFPFSVVWGPLGPLTCCCPCVGHMGIADSQGKIHDFAGPYRIGIDRFMVGCVLRYAPVEGAEGDPEAWDAAIHRADAEYKQRMHNICCDNCHHHAALALEESGRPQCSNIPCGGLLSTWIHCCLNGTCNCA